MAFATCIDRRLRHFVPGNSETTVSCRCEEVASAGTDVEHARMLDVCRHGPESGERLRVTLRVGGFVDGLEVSLVVGVDVVLVVVTDRPGCAEMKERRPA
jgi:hypothetical protein